MAAPVTPSTPGMDCWGRGGGLWAGDWHSHEPRGWEYFRAGGQIDFSSAVSALMHSSAASGITPKTSRGHDPEGRKPWVVLAGPGALTLQAPAGRAGGETPERAEKGSSWHTQGNQIPIETQQHFIHMLSYVLPSRGCVNKP